MGDDPKCGERPVYARTGDWARRTHEAFAEFFAETGGIYLDIGANIGLTTPPIAQNPLVNCFAFEPEPTNFGNLQENVWRNTRHENVTLCQLALLDRAGFIPFGLSDDGNLGDHRVMTTIDRGRRSIQVAAAPLDALNLPITGQLAIKLTLKAPSLREFWVNWRHLRRQASLFWSSAPT